ncbi:MAG: hypothetical protein ACI9PC_000028 [Porticoccaceae bacterium]|jgi:hypothetical protein
MESFVANHYTAKAFYVLDISIWGSGVHVNFHVSFIEGAYEGPTSKLAALIDVENLQSWV